MLFWKTHTHATMSSRRIPFFTQSEIGIGAKVQVPNVLTCSDIYYEKKSLKRLRGFVVVAQ